jgi:inward rectifier potassium channel
LFALLYVSLGPEALRGGVATSLAGRLQEAFFFSVHTLATIGYGNIVPASVAANILDSLEALTGLLGVAIVAGIGFARVSRPVAGVKFSDVAVVAPYHGGTGLMFRLANTRHHELIRVSVAVSISYLRPDGTRAFHALDLERSEVVFMPTSWTVVHPIGRSSPLFGIDRDTFVARRPEIFVLLSATEEVFFQVVHARFSYASGEIRWGARFRSILEYDRDGIVSRVDIGGLSEVEPAPLPV